MATRKRKKKQTYTPFSKQTITYARLEAYVFTLILIFMVWHGRDVSAIAAILSLAWAGYRLIQGLYINMAKHEHLMDKKLEYKKLELSTHKLDQEIENLEDEDFEREGIY